MLLNNSINFYDSGLILNYIFNFEKYDKLYLYYGHVRIYLYPLIWIKNNFSFEISIFIISAIKYLILYFPIIYFLKKKKVLIYYLLSPFLIYYSFGTYNYDYLIVPLLIYSIFNIEKKKSLIFLLLIFLILISIKISMFFLVIVPYTIRVIKSNEKKINKLIFLSIPPFFLFYIFFLTTNFIKIEEIIDPNKLLNYQQIDINFLKKLIFFIFIVTLNLSILDKKFLFKVLGYIFPYILILLYLQKDNYINVFNHYSLALFPVFLFFFNETNNCNKNILKFVLLLFFFFSPYPGSFLFFNKNLTDRFYYEKYLQKNLNDISDEIKNNKIQLVNNSFNYRLLKYNEIFPLNKNIGKTHILICELNCDFFSRLSLKSKYVKKELIIDYIYFIDNKYFFENDLKISKEYFYNYYIGRIKKTAYEDFYIPK